MGLSFQRIALAAGLAAAAAGVSGCSDAKTENNKAEIRQVVAEFSAEHGPRACSLLTDNALQKVYGGYSEPVSRSRRNCIAASKHFRGDAAKLGVIAFVNSTTATANATNSTNTVGYQVTLHKIGSRWKIDQIIYGKAVQ